MEAKIFELQEAMADRGYSDIEIEEKVTTKKGSGWRRWRCWCGAVFGCCGRQIATPSTSAMSVTCLSRNSPRTGPKRLPQRHGPGVRCSARLPTCFLAWFHHESASIPSFFLRLVGSIPKVAEVRKGLEEREESGQKASLLKGGKKGGGGGGGGGAGAMDSHMRDVRKAEDNRRMRDAFGLGDDFAAGEAFDEAAQDRKKEARRK